MARELMVEYQGAIHHVAIRRVEHIEGLLGGLRQKAKQASDLTFKG